jgi:hypothetical protein
MENAGTARGPFNQSAYPQPDIKARFYRYFQGEVTGTAPLFSRLHLLTSNRATRTDNPSGKQRIGWGREARGHRPLHCRYS